MIWLGYSLREAQDSLKIQKRKRRKERAKEKVKVKAKAKKVANDC
jgi:hypothetical protein